jgi:hypothetical protein
MTDKKRQIPILIVVAIAAAGIVVGFVLGSTGIASSFLGAHGANVVKSSMSIVDANGVPVANLTPDSAVFQGTTDITNKYLRTRMLTSFTINSEAPIQDWTISGVANLKVNGNSARAFQISMTGTSASETNLPLLIRDQACTTCAFADSNTISIADLVKGVPLTYTGDLNVELYLNQLQIIVHNTGGGTATGYATPNGGASLSTMTLHQQGDPITPSVGVGSFTATSGEVTLQETP